MKENVLNEKFLCLKQLLKTLFKLLINHYKKLLIKQSILILSGSINLIGELNKYENYALEELNLLFSWKTFQKLENLFRILLLFLISIWEPKVIKQTISNLLVDLLIQYVYVFLKKSHSFLSQMIAHWSHVDHCIIESFFHFLYRFILNFNYPIYLIL